MNSLSHYGIPYRAATAPDAICNTIGGATSGISQQRGFSQEYSSKTGRKVQIGDVNGMFQMASQAGYFNQHGGFHTFSQEVSDLIGGYPLGAILYWFDDENQKIRTVRSMKANNTDDFVSDPDLIDGASWKFVDQIPASKVSVFMFAEDVAKTGVANSTSPWVAPYDCAVFFSSASFMSYGGSSVDVLRSFIQIMNEEDEGYGTAGVISCSFPQAVCSAVYGNGDWSGGDPHVINPVSGRAAQTVAYVKKGGKVRAMSDSGGTASVSFTYYPLTC